MSMIGPYNTSGSRTLSSMYLSMDKVEVDMTLTFALRSGDLRITVAAIEPGYKKYFVTDTDGVEHVIPFSTPVSPGR